MYLDFYKVIYLLNYLMVFFFLCSLVIYNYVSSEVNTDFQRKSVFFSEFSSYWYGEIYIQISDSFFVSMLLLPQYLEEEVSLFPLHMSNQSDHLNNFYEFWFITIFFYYFVFFSLRLLSWRHKMKLQKSNSVKVEVVNICFPELLDMSLKKLLLILWNSLNLTTELTELQVMSTTKSNFSSHFFTHNYLTYTNYHFTQIILYIHIIYLIHH